MVDFCNDGIRNNQSKSKLAQKEINGIYKKYHDTSIGTIKDSDMEAAVKDIEDEVNKITNIALSFDYEKYVEAFARSFNHHYEKIDIYKENTEIKNTNTKVGFLIELHCDTQQMNAIWNGSLVQFASGRKSFPITKEIMVLFKNATKLDFIIVAQFNEGVFTEASDVKIYEPNNLDESLKRQRITVYDRIVYSGVRRNLSLNLEKDSE